MATENLIYLKFASRVDALQLSTVVRLKCSFGDVRANYMSGTEIYREAVPNNYWQYQFEVSNVDIPSGYTIADVTEAALVAPYVEVWGTFDVCGDGCFELVDIEEDADPDWIMSATEDPLNAGSFCPSRISPADLALQLTPLLDIDALIALICPACECGALSVLDEGVSTVDPATILNFTGAGVTVTDAGGGQADIDIPGGSGIVAYGGIKGTGELTSTAIAAATWEPLIECWDSNMPFENMTPDQASGLVTIDETGDYLVNASVSFIPGTDGATYSFEIYVDGVAANLRAESSAADLERQCVSITGILSLIPTEEVQIYVTSDSGIDSVTATQAQLNLHYLGETTGG
jgi:hypothetical protein